MRKCGGLPVNMDLSGLTYRKDPLPYDREIIREIVDSTGFFSEEEVEIAVELVDERLSKGIPSGYHFLFAESDGRVIGYTCFGPIPGTMESYDLYWIAVRNDLRGAGIGRKLMQAAETEILSMGGKRIYVDTSSRDLYKPTHAFYLNSGYKEEALLKDFYSPGDDKLIFVKVI